MIIVTTTVTIYMVTSKAYINALLSYMSPIYIGVIFFYLKYTLYKSGDTCFFHSLFKWLSVTTFVVTEVVTVLV